MSSDKCSLLAGSGLILLASFIVVVHCNEIVINLHAAPNPSTSSQQQNHEESSQQVHDAPADHQHHQQQSYNNHDDHMAASASSESGAIRRSDHFQGYEEQQPFDAIPAKYYHFSEDDQKHRPAHIERHQDGGSTSYYEPEMHQVRRPGVKYEPSRPTPGVKYDSYNSNPTKHKQQYSSSPSKYEYLHEASPTKYRKESYSGERDHYSASGSSYPESEHHGSGSSSYSEHEYHGSGPSYAESEHHGSHGLSPGYSVSEYGSVELHDDGHGSYPTGPIPVPIAIHAEPNHDHSYSHSRPHRVSPHDTYSYNLELGEFALLFIPAALLTLVYMFYVAANSPNNSHSKYFIDGVGSVGPAMSHKPHQDQGMGMMGGGGGGGGHMNQEQMGMMSGGPNQLGGVNGPMAPHQSFGWRSLNEARNAGVQLTQRVLSSIDNNNDKTN